MTRVKQKRINVKNWGKKKLEVECIAGEEKIIHVRCDVRMSEIDRNRTRGNESDCVRFPACVFVLLEKEKKKEERKKERRMKPRQKESAREKKKVAGGDTRVSKDVMRECSSERERNAM